MNLADAIRKAAGQGLAGEKQTNHWKEEIHPETVAGGGTPSVFTEPAPAPHVHTAPVPMEHTGVGGNAVRLEIFLSGEQMAAMLKAIMAGQHSVLTLREAASYLRVSSSTLLRYVEEGEIPAVELDGRYRFPKSNLDDWLANQGSSGEESQDVA